MTEEAYAIYMAFKNYPKNLFEARVMITCDHEPLCKFLTAHTLNSKVKNCGREIASMSHVTFVHIKETEIFCWPNFSIKIDGFL